MAPAIRHRITSLDWTLGETKGNAIMLSFTWEATSQRHERNNFKVADAVLRRAEEYTRVQWEIALRKAKERADLGKWPVIRRGDF